MSTATIEKDACGPGAKAAEDVTPETASNGVTQLVSFRLANEEYGVDIMRVQEIILMGEITKMPQVPDFICGLINLRGNVIPIVDLRKRFGLPMAQATEHTRIIVVNLGTRTIGMVVDAVNEVLRINEQQTEPPPSSVAGIDHKYINGLIKLEDKLLILLNIESILSDDERGKLSDASNQAN